MPILFINKFKRIVGKQSFPDHLKITKCYKRVEYILNKSENATPELFVIYIQNYANQECN